VSTETRVFESVDNSPEAKAANAAYFAEQDITHEVTDDAAEGDTKSPADTSAAAAAPPAKTGEEAAAAPEVDAETAAEWDSDKTDVQRKSRSAKIRQERREFKTQAEQEKARADKAERELAELKAGKPADKVDPKPEERAAPPAEAATPATFSEAEPPEPKYEDFATSDDQLLAYQQALAKHTREWTRWDRRREAFETNAAAEAKRKTDQAAEQHNQRLTKLNERLAVVRAEHPDFDEVTKLGNVMSLALQAASVDLPDGLKLAYQLAKDPAKLQQFNDLTKATQKIQGRDMYTPEAYNLAMFLFGQMSGSPAPAAAATPAAAASTSSPQPREEPPAPRPARGRASDEPRMEDLSGDARRDRLAAGVSR
jgi:hypothetical protein